MGNLWNYLTVLVAVLWTTEADVRQPPSIFEGPEHDIIFRTEMAVELPCRASGQPQPEYEWFVNGRYLDVNEKNMKLSPDPADGSLTIDPILRVNEGYYQCMAKNPYGISMSNITRLQQAIFQMNFSTEVRTYRVVEGDSLYMECYRPFKSVPKPSFVWSTVTKKMDSRPKAYMTNRRVQMTMDGDLLFSNVEQRDDQGGRLFKCNAFNPSLDIMAAGRLSKIIVMPNPRAPNRAPAVMYATKDGTVALLGGTLTIECFFAAKPAARLSWRKLGVNSTIAPGRHKFKSYNTKVYIDDIQWSDEGAYECKGVNSAGSIKHQVHIFIHSLPTFMQHPVNTNATEGEDQVFTCKADGKPTPDIQWYINGEALDYTNPGHRREISRDGTELIFRKLCKSCPDGSSDLMVVQCNASNIHGSVFSEGYLNVLT